MRSLATDLMSAISDGSLKTTIVDTEEGFSIAILIAGDEVGRIGSLYGSRPRATVSDGWRGVEVLPSPGLMGGFSIRCGSATHAKLISQELDRSLAATHAALRGDQTTDLQLNDPV